MINLVSDLAQVGGIKFHLKIFLTDFCFVMKLTNYRSACTAAGVQALQFIFNSLFNEHFPR